MELKQLRSIIHKRLWMVIVFPLLIAIITGLLCEYVITPLYEADTTLYVLNKSSDSKIMTGQQELMAGQLLVKDYRELLKSRIVTEEVIKELSLPGMTNEKLVDSISVQSKNDTRVIEIKVINKNPELAKDIANKLGDIFISKATQLMGIENIKIFDRATTPEKPVEPKPLLYTFAAYFFGIVIVAVIIYLIENMNTKISNSEDVEKIIGLPVLGSIPVFSIK